MVILKHSDSCLVYVRGQVAVTVIIINYIIAQEELFSLSNGRTQVCVGKVIFFFKDPLTSSQQRWNSRPGLLTPN